MDLYSVLPSWQKLVHVCQRWRSIVFASPLRLDLFLVCTSRTSVRKLFDVWPPLPIEIILERAELANIIAALEYRGRVRKIWFLHLAGSQWERVAPMMQKPFPALTFLHVSAAVLIWDGETIPVLPDMFLGGSAPRLQTLLLRGVRFPGLPRFLLSTTDLSRLTLEGIPHTGYISPEVMVTSLSTLTRLTELTIEFESPASRPERRGPPPLTRVILPALEELRFHGVNEYLEDFVARIDTPRVHTLNISFFHQLIFDIQQLSNFIRHVGLLRSSNDAKLIFFNDHIDINLSPLKATDFSKKFNLRIYCGAIDSQVSSIAQICNQFSFSLSIVEQLNIQVPRYLGVTSQLDIESTQWLELFRPFTAVRILRIHPTHQSCIASALQELSGERATEVFPALNKLYVFPPEDRTHLLVYKPSGSDQQAIESFVAARQHSDHPVAVHHYV